MRVLAVLLFSSIFVLTGCAIATRDPEGPYSTREVDTMNAFIDACSKVAVPLITVRSDDKIPPEIQRQVVENVLAAMIRPCVDELASKHPLLAWRYSRSAATTAATPTPGPRVLKPVRSVPAPSQPVT
ncbi:MAG: hypothetical protein JWL82_577 [Parcubacteria group bacterium]|nr:hypothetical protein [Parcubacteria group bacterium]